MASPTSLSLQLFCIHGFLGQASDWDQVLPPGLPTTRFDLFKPKPSDLPSLSFSSLSQWVTSKALQHKGPRVLVGYSLGGRIALHTLLDNPGVWDGAVIISAHPGLSDEQERAKRKQADEKWAKRFENSDWNSVIADWNSQPTLQGSQTLEKNENQFSRPTLAESLKECSLGNQKDLREKISQLKQPILWMVGEKDLKFLNLAQELAAFSKKTKTDSFSLAVIPNANHRAPWDQTAVFQYKLISFLTQIHKSKSG